MTTLRMTLASGETFERTVVWVPRHWQSWMMRQAPYGSDWQGVRFTTREA